MQANITFSIKYFTCFNLAKKKSFIERTGPVATDIQIQAGWYLAQYTHSRPGSGSRSPCPCSPVAATAASPAGWWVGLYPQPLARLPLLFQLPLSAGLLFPGIGGDGRHRHMRCVGAFTVRFHGGVGEAGETPWPCACGGLDVAGWRRQNSLASDGCGRGGCGGRRQRHSCISVS